MANKFDLSADEITLDYQELLDVVIVAVASTKVLLDQSIRRWESFGNSEPVSPVYAESMLSCATSLERATKAWYYLYHGKDRMQVNVVNHG